tara:strand:- start:911 stop:1420 length:510 start_codon:yes stop_codon:yes gene_type:complete
MPSTSKKQHNFMAAVANNPKFAKKAGVPQSVGKDFTEADKGMKFKGGTRVRPDLQKVNEPKTLQGKTELFKQGGNTMATKMGKPTMKPGMSMAKDGMKKPTPMAKTDMAGSMMGMKKGGAPMKKMAAGGLSGGHKAADGVASKGKTKGMQVSMSGNKGMKSGGMAKKYC